VSQLALSAASPIYRGFLADTDCRWNVIAASVDDRTREERGIDVSLSSLILFLSSDVWETESRFGFFKKT